MTHRIRAVIGLVFSLAIWEATAASTAFDAGRYLDHIKYLASPEMRGRATGSRELEKAAQYISEQFRSDGLRPPDGKSYLQAFDVDRISSQPERPRSYGLKGRKIPAPLRGAIQVVATGHISGASRILQRFSTASVSPA